jgi:hypothetical protein
VKHRIRGIYVLRVRIYKCSQAENMKVRSRLEGLCVDGLITLKWNVDKYGVELWTALHWLGRAFKSWIM